MQKWNKESKGDTKIRGKPFESDENPRVSKGRMSLTPKSSLSCES